MTTVVLALVSALCYGCSDFVGGVASRRSSAWAVSVVGQLAGATSMLLLALTRSGSPTATDFAWGAVAGLGSGLGTGFLYRGLSSGRMSVVAPVSGVGAAVVPALAGFLGGERPGALVWAGIVIALPAIWLVSSSSDHQAAGSQEGRTSLRDSGLVDGLLAGLSFGLLFACLGQVPRGAGLWPAVVTQAVGLPAVIALALALRGRWLPTRGADWWGVVPGTLATGASLFFLLATQSGLLAVAGVLSALYPAGTVLLALAVLRERLSRAQSSGLLLAVAAVVLVASG